MITIALEDAYFKGVLSSKIHVEWSLFIGTRLGVGDDPRYAIDCFETFPFPALEEGPLKQRIRDLGERLDAHRKARQAAHPELTLTGIYNVLEKLRAGEPLTDKEKKIHDDGLVTILKQIHDDLDAAVYEAYGWSDLAVETQDFKTQDARKEEFEQELLKRLVVLNHERAEEEKRGLVRWLRPEYQAPGSTLLPEQKEIDLGTGSTESPPDRITETPVAWPSTLSEQVTAIQKLLPATGPDPAALAAHFGKRTKARIHQITEILKTLEGLGKL